MLHCHSELCRVHIHMYTYHQTSSDRPERVFERKREATRKTFLKNCQEVPRGRTNCSPEAHAARGRRCLVAGGFVVSLPCCDPTRARVGRDFGPERRHKEPQHHISDQSACILRQLDRTRDFGYENHPTRSRSGGETGQPRYRPALGRWRWPGSVEARRREGAEKTPTCSSPV